MKVLLIGSGGREHALAWKLHQSPKLSRLFIAPGNPGTATLGVNVPIKADDIDALLRFALEEGIALTLVGPETPLVLGIVDRFQAKGLAIWGPGRSASALEGSKVAMKEFLRRHNVPTASFRLFNRPADAHAYIDEVGAPQVVKCDGLAAGKGVTVARTPEAAHQAISRIMERFEFGREAGKQVVIEEVLRGDEISALAFCDGHNAVLLDYAQDHKQLLDDDEGPMTGGMGAFSPVPGLVKARDEDELVRRIVVPTLSGLVHESRPFVGLLYIGLMLTESGPRVLEYNVRFGDPECQALMLRLKTDLIDICLATLAGTLDTLSLEWRPETSVCINLVSRGYPDRHPVDLPITGLDDPACADTVIFHAGTRERQGDLLTAGGRVLSVCALGSDLEEARTRAYRACQAIRFDGKHLRQDIGHRREARKVR